MMEGEKLTCPNLKTSSQSGFLNLLAIYSSAKMLCTVHEIRR